MPQWPAGARSYQTEVLGDAQGAVVFFTNTPHEFGHEIPHSPTGQGAQVRHIVGGAAGGGYEWTNPGASAPRDVNAIKLNSRGQIVQLTSIWDGSLVTPAWITQHMSTTIES
jgi:hypothetical protein